MAWEMNSFTDTMFRQRVVAQIDAAREGFELEPGANSSEEMENVLFQKAGSREEYMRLIAGLVLHLNEKKREARRGKAPEPQSNGATADQEVEQQRKGAAKS